MRILHTIEGMGGKFGGIATCTHDLLTAMQEGEDRVELLSPSLRDSSDYDLCEGEPWSRHYPNDGVGPMNFSKNLQRELKDSDADLYHTNGMWQYIVHATCATARHKRKPYVITPHGMLYPETLKRSYWKKWPLIQLWFRKDVMRASAIHATCEQEMQHIRELGYRGPIALIGNPVPVTPEVTDIYEKRLTNPETVANSPRKIGFLGRLHPRKNCEAILRGISLRPDADVQVVLMGTGNAEYEQFLRNEAQRLGIADRVEFAGFVSGREKFERLAQLDALFVPSDMENFGMIIPEALLVGTPVMASLGTPWQSLNENRCGWWTDNSPESIAKVIDDILAKTPAQLLEMGGRGRKLVLDRFEASQVASQMLALYHWLGGTAPRPEFVDIIK